jgi:hypothetical protein
MRILAKSKMQGKGGSSYLEVVKRFPAFLIRFALLKLLASLCRSADMPNEVLRFAQSTMLPPDQEKRKLRKGLKNARSMVYLSFDLWTSPNFYSLAGIIGHAIDSNGHRQTQLLAIRRVHGGYCGIGIRSTSSRIMLVSSF